MDAALLAALGDDVMSSTALVAAPIFWTALVAAPGDEGRRRHLLDRDHCRAGGRGAVDAALFAALGDGVMSWTALVAVSISWTALVAAPGDTRQQSRPPVLLPRDLPRPPTTFLRCLSVLSFSTAPSNSLCQ